MKKYFLFLFLLLLSAWGWSFELQDGDLLFQVGQGSAFEQAISSATEGIDGAAFTHVGIAQVRKGQPFVWEASTQGGVRRVPLQAFLDEAAQNGGPLVEVFRFKAISKKQVRKAIKRLKKLEGKPYDFLFLPNNDAYYCSELVQTVFLDKDGHFLFPSVPMSFNDKKTGKLSPWWKEYFEQRNAPVPQGVPGTNPGDMSKSALLTRVHRYY